MNDSATAPLWLAVESLPRLFEELKSRGYSVIGPTVSQEAIIYDEITSVDDLPRGWTDIQSPGEYRLARRQDDALFGYVVGPHSWKRFLFPPQACMAVVERSENGWQFTTHGTEAPRFAFIGVRACELAAIRIQDRVFMEGPYVDPIYRARREAALFVAVNCTLAGSNCFCTSMNTGPRCETGFDLALTEIDGGFIVEIGTEKGQTILDPLDLPVAGEAELDRASSARQQASDQITKRLDTSNLRDLLLGNLEHPRWQEVAERCLSCTNCTMVCPTCFCSSVREVSDLEGDHIERQREWDSCFNFDFSYLNGGVIRNDVRSRYRQWLTHKLASWHDQFDSSGCVGCGRCITWCPVGIDLTEEVAAIRKETT